MSKAKTNENPEYLQEAESNYRGIQPGGFWFDGTFVPVKAIQYIQALEQHRDELQVELKHARRLKRGKKGKVNPGVITDCYSIVCGKCRLWVTSYRSSSRFVMEDLDGAGWKLTRNKGWICPECAAK